MKTLRQKTLKTYTNNWTNRYGTLKMTNIDRHRSKRNYTETTEKTEDNGKANVI